MSTIKINGINIKIAKSFSSRFLGFMMKKKADYGILLYRCTSIHTFFMKFNIDVMFLNKENIVIAVVKNVKPWKILLPYIKNTYSIMEIPAGLTDSESLINKKIEF